MGDSVVVAVSSSVAVEKRREDEVLMEKRAGLIAAIAEPERECPLMLLLLPLPNKVEWLEIAAIRRALLALLVMLPSDLLDTDDTDVDDGDAGRKASADLHHDVDVDRMVAIMMTMLPPIFMTADETEGKEGRVQIRYGYL